MTKIELVIQEILEDTYIQVVELGFKLPPYDINKYNIRTFYNDGYYTTHTPTAHNDLILESIGDLDDPIDKDIEYKAKRKLGSIFMDSYSRIYNFAVMIPHGDTGLLARDFIEIQNNPKLLASMALYGVTHDHKDLEGSYKVLDHEVRNNTSEDNWISAGYVAGAFKKDQFNMQFSCRGPVADRYANIYSTPVTSSYGIGVCTLPGMVIDAKTAENAIKSVNTDIGVAEGLAKRARSNAAYIAHLIDDCGTTDGLDWVVAPKGSINGIKYKGDMPFMCGLYFYRYEDGKFSDKLECITNKMIKDRSLDNKRIKIRTQLTCIAASDTTCKICAGRSSELRVQGKNFGIINSAPFLNPFNQATLSPKHRVAAAALALISLNELIEDHYSLELDNRTVFTTLNTFTVSVSQAPTNTPFGSYITQVYIPEITKKVDISDSKLPLVLNKKFREYLQYCPSTKTRNNVTYHIDEWDKNISIGNMPDSTVNFTVILKTFKRMLESSFDGTLEEYWKQYVQINTVIGVNWSSIMTVAASRLTTIDGRQVKGRDAVVLKLASQIVSNVTNGLYMGRPNKTLTASADRDTDDHILDVLLVPEILNEERMKGR